MKLSPILLGTTALLAPQLAGAQDADIKVAVKRLYENRYADFIKDRNFSPSRNNMTLVLRFTGPGIENATRVGKLAINTLKDDQGNAIRGANAYAAPSSRLRRLSRPRPFGKQAPPPKDRFDLTISMPAAKRGATKIAALRGQITFRIAKTASVKIPLSQLEDGKPIASPELKKLGIVATCSKVSIKSSPNVRLKITGGKRDSFLVARFVDLKGKLVDTGTFSYSTSQAINSTTSSYRALPADTVLNIVVETEYKDVPLKLDLKDIPLP
jgi:hypothetical protein